MRRKNNPVTIKKHFALIILCVFVLLGCSENTSSIPTPISTSTLTLTPIPTFTPKATLTSPPTLTPKPFVDIRKTLVPDIYVVYWSQHTWYIRGVNGYESKQLIPSISSEINTILELSPDGNQVALSSTAGELSVYSLQYGTLKSYPNPDVNGVYEIKWLPNGQTILYSGNLRDTKLPDDPIGIYGVSLKTNSTFIVVNAGDERFKYGLRGMTLSNDGKWLAFYAPSLSEIWSPNPEYSIYLMNMSCLEILKTCSESIQHVGYGIHPTWSPNGKLGWDCSGENKSRLCYVDTNKVEESQILLDISRITPSSKIRFADFSWSPDGKFIAVTLVKPLENNIANDVSTYIVIVSANGKQVLEVTSLSDSASSWEGWSPDSRYLAYSNYLAYTEPYGEVDARSPMKYLYFYDTQTGLKKDLVGISSDREVFDFFFEIK